MKLGERTHALVTDLTKKLKLGVMIVLKHGHLHILLYIYKI